MKASEMPARELDALVAEKVMGFDVFFLGFDKECPVIRKDDSSSYLVPHYSTDISAAWKVVDTMHSRGCSVEIRQWAYPDAKWMVEIGGTGLRAESDTAPKAICLAILRDFGFN